jgi:hypothetical protein
MIDLGTGNNNKMYVVTSSRCEYIRVLAYLAYL